MNVEKILGNLEKLGFAKKEAEVFLELLKNPNSNGSQIAKVLGYPRTTVYQNLDILEKKGYIRSYLDKEITYYEAIDTDELFDIYKQQVSDATKVLKEEFKKIDFVEKEKQFYNLNSYDKIKLKVKQMLKRAKTKVIINTNLSLKEFEKDFKELEKRGVRVVLFSFDDMDHGDIKMEKYIRSSFDIVFTGKEKRLMMSVDLDCALIASNYGGSFHGTYSENELLVRIVSEHIGNDINIMRIEEKYGNNVVKSTALKF